MKPGLFDNPQAHFSACLIPLVVTDLARIAITYHYSIDRGLWPLFLAFMIGASFLYAGLAHLLAYLRSRYYVSIALRHHAVLGAMQVGHTLAYFLLKPDWLAVNSGVDELTPLQSIVHNHWTPLAIYLVFYIILIFRTSKPNDQR